MHVNVVGPMLCAKHAVRAMSTAHGGKGGSIVTIAGVLAKAPPGDWGIALPCRAPAVTGG
jgi:NAD(P)-dependent dehydrogenase (short-subunit alcohol dehydrogenase family)